MPNIQIPRLIVNGILSHAQHSPEQEICGLIAARDGRPTRCVRVKNASREPGHLFAMDPKEQIDAMREFREQGEELFGIYHSHPHAPAAPSPRDLAEAAYPEALYLIVSLNTKGVLEMRGFHLRDHEVEGVDLEVV